MNVDVIRFEMTFQSENFKYKQFGASQKSAKASPAISPFIATKDNGRNQQTG